MQVAGVSRNWHTPFRRGTHASQTRWKCWYVECMRCGRHTWHLRSCASCPVACTTESCRPWPCTPPRLLSCGVVHSDAHIMASQLSHTASIDQLRWQPRSRRSRRSAGLAWMPTAEPKVCKSLACPETCIHPSVVAHMHRRHGGNAGMWNACGAGGTHGTCDPAPRAR